MKKKIIKLLAGFFIVMLCCTVIARAADSFTVAKAETGHVKAGRLTTKFEGGGSIRSADSVTQTFPEGQKIKKLLVKAGDKVSLGSSLALLDLEYLNKCMKEQSAKVEKLRLQAEQQELAAQRDSRVPETASAKIALQAAERVLSQAQEKYQRCAEEYDAYVNSAGSEMTEEEYQLWEQNRETLERAAEAAAEAVNAADLAYAQAADSYHLAESSEAAALEKEAKAGKTAALALDALRVDLEGEQKKLEKLQTIQSSEGNVKAEQEGMVMEIGAKEGAVTTGSEQMVFSSGGYEACGSLPADAVGKVLEGDKVKVKISGSAKPVELTISRLRQNKTETEKENELELTWYAKLEGDTHPLGTVLTYEISKNSSAEYQKLIPLSALHAGSGTDYVLTLEKRNGILGESYVAVKVLVTILDKDQDNAAVDPGVALDKEVKFITSANKYVEEGDRVRPVESKKP